MTDQPQWSSLTFGHRIYAIYRLPAGSQWRYLKDAKGEKRTFLTTREAEKAARDRALELLFPPAHGVVTEKEAAEALGVEEWLRSRREDKKAAYVERRAGKRPLVVVQGRAR